MKPLLKALIALFSAPLLVAGAGLFFSPENFAARLHVVPEGAAGLNTLRGAMGGLLFSSGLMMVLGLLRKNTFWFLSVALVMAVVSFGRVVGLAVDGIDPEVIRPLVVELVLVGVLVAGHRHLAE